MVAITSIDINLLITSLTFMPILLAKSPTVIVSPTLIRLLIALGTVISVFFILTGATFLLSRHLVKIISFSSSCFFSLFSIFFSKILRCGTAFSSSINTSIGTLPLFFGFSGGGMAIFSPGLRDPLGGIAVLVSGRVILCLEMIDGFAGTTETRGGCLTFPAAVVSAAGGTSTFAVVSTFGILNLSIGASAGCLTPGFSFASPSGIFSLDGAETALVPKTGDRGGSSFLTLSIFPEGGVAGTFLGIPVKSFSR